MSLGYKQEDWSPGAGAIEEVEILREKKVGGVFMLQKLGYKDHTSCLNPLFSRLESGSFRW